MGAQISGSANASAVANTVLIGPITIDQGKCDVSMVAKTIAGTVTTPTNPKLQYSHDNVTFVDVASGAVTVSSSSSTASEVTKLDIVCKYLRVVAAGAFAAGNAAVTLFGIEK